MKTWQRYLIGYLCLRLCDKNGQAEVDDNDKKNYGSNIGHPTNQNTFCEIKLFSVGEQKSRGQGKSYRLL